MGAKILLPCKAHVKKYLEHLHGNQIEVSDRGYISLLLLNMLEKHKKKDPATVRPSQKMIDHQSFFPYPIYIGSNYESSRGLYISQVNIKKFNEAVDDLFRENMYYYVNHPNAIDSIVDYNIIRYRDMFGITEDELPFDNLKRWYYRERLRFVDRKNYTPQYTPQYTLTF